jgi:hypothetical protein
VPVIIRRIENADAANITSQGLRLRLDIQPGVNYIVEYSEDLQTWILLSTLNSIEQVGEVMDTAAKTKSRRFYRVREESAP